MDEAFIEAFPVNCCVIHINLHNTLHHITENTEHTTQKSGQGIAKTEGHPPIGICTKRTSESGLFLIIGNDLDLEIARIPI